MRYQNVSKHLFRRTARDRERLLTHLMDREDWDALEMHGVEDPEGVEEFRVSPNRRNGYWRVQSR